MKTTRKEELVEGGEEVEEGGTEPADGEEVEEKTEKLGNPEILIKMKIELKLEDHMSPKETLKINT